MSFRPLKGTDDLLAPRSQEWREALDTWEQVSALFGYPLVMTPLFESTELFERGVGETTEVVTKQMYTFTDKGKRSVTLRPEGTAGVVRAYLNSGQRGPWKGAYSGPFFRYEQPQAGRRRQFWQVGVEYLDVASPVADAEVIELGWAYLSKVGVSELRLVLNSLGDPNCRPQYVEALVSYLEGRQDELSPDSVRLISVNPLRVLDSKADAKVLTDPPSLVDHLCQACKDHHESVKGALDALGIPYQEDASLVRGLDYYTRTAFEYIGTGLEAAQNALGGGGRYDGLAEALGGRAMPGVGLALGLDRIMLAVGEATGSYLDAYLVSETGPADALAAVSHLRRLGLRVDFDTEGRKVDAQFKSANRLGVEVVLVLKGPGAPLDVKRGEERVPLALDEIPAWLGKDQ